MGRGMVHLGAQVLRFLCHSLTDLLDYEVARTIVRPCVLRGLYGGVSVGVNDFYGVVSHRLTE